MPPAVNRLEVPLNYNKYLQEHLHRRPTHRPRGADRRCALVRDVEVGAARDYGPELADGAGSCRRDRRITHAGGSAAWPDDYREVKGWSEGTALPQEAMEEAGDESREGPAGRLGAGDDSHHGVCLGQFNQGPGK